MTLSETHRRNGLPVVTLICLGLAVSWSLPLVADDVATSEATVVQFNRDVRPILSDKCFACHGPDEAKRQASLRLDTREGSRADLGGRFAIVPGDAAKSELVRRINSTDPDEAMPPAKHPKQLTAAERKVLERWVRSGAKYEGLWSLSPMQRPALPKVNGANEQQGINDIDRFVIAALEEQARQNGRVPGTLAKSATKERLIRRATFDLTGLPPTVSEIDAFLKDNSPEAYERVIDRLLKSPRYGERMATEWLDVARFADTHGYQMDRFRPMWAYRDWVIKAFNDNLSFDQFTTWQLAGDLLPAATKDQQLATAFNRLHCQNEEGGVVEEEFRVAYVADRVNTFGTAFLGLTFECSRCHDHKYDPITQKDFYSLFSFFQNIDEYGQTTYFTSSMPVPTVLVSTDDQDARLTDFRRQIADREGALQAVRDAAQAPFQKWLTSKPEQPEPPKPLADYHFDSLDKSVLINSANEKQPGRGVDNPQLVPAEGGTPTNMAASLNGDNGFTFPGVGHFTRADAFSIAIAVKPNVVAPRAVVYHHSKAPADAGSRGYELLLEEGRAAFGLHHMWPGNSLKVRTRKPLPLKEWSHVTVTYDGSSRAAGVLLYVNGLKAEVDIVRDGLWKDITYEGGEPNLEIGHRFRDAGFKQGQVDSFVIYGRTLTSLEVAHIAGRDDLKEAWRRNNPDATDPLLFETFLATSHTPWQEALAALHTVRDEQRRFINPIPEVMAMREMTQSKPAFILKRGNYDQPTVGVEADTPKSLPPLAPDAPRNRLGLATWLTDAEHPLTARVTVNRAWQMLFGRGIVETSDNFGSQGTLPTHPELLDWLARDFIANGWDVKRMLKQMMMSATYRQESVVASEWQAFDPDNRWLSHASPRRLTAEMLRDGALFSGGLLVEKQGGPSVKPYQPTGLWDIAMGRPQYDQGKGADLYRRSLYTFWKRTVPPPAPMIFDAADRSYCTVRRQSTSTPLQALALLNDIQIVEAARFVAQRTLKEGGETPESQTNWMFRLLTGRGPSSKEQSILVQMRSEQRELFSRDEVAVQKLLNVGEAKPDKALSPIDLAAATHVALALLNHDEALIRR